MNFIDRQDRLSKLAKATVRLSERREATKCESSLLDFSEYVWPVVEPAIPFIRGWVLEAICEHLEGVSHGYIRRLLINVPPGFTKALDHDTPVFTTWGWKRHGDLQVNEFVFGPDGQPKRIIACSEEMVKEAYEISFDDGTTVVAGGDHLWEIERDVMSVAPHYRRGRKAMVVKTLDLRVSGQIRGKVPLKPDRIAVAAPIHSPPQHLLIDPYILGAWLGDGYSNAGMICASQQDVANLLQYSRIGTTYPAGRAGRTQDFYRLTVDGLHASLKALGLLKNKHIPSQYMVGSIEQRWALLQGLMDTDGCAAKNGRCCFSNKNLRLINQVHELACSLGLKATVTSHEAKLRGRSYGKHYLVGFTPTLSDSRVFRLERKQNRIVGGKNKRSQYRFIKSVKFLGLRTMKCIQVEGNLYLAGKTFLCTHNSLMTDVFWPAWEWGPRNLPWLRYVCASYSNHLTERDNMRCRNIVISDRYKRLWGDRFRISNEQFTKIKFANDKTGWKLATSVGGIGVGERGDRFIIDDPNNTMEMESEQTRNTTNMWFTEVVPDRLNNQKTSAIVVIQQRLHEDDVSGIAISREMGYTHLMVPMEHDVKRHCVTVVGMDEIGKPVRWEDPRSKDNELAWPERFPYEIVRELERDKGPYAWAGQYQQTPEPRGGSIVKRDYWKVWEKPNFEGLEYILASLDTAYTEKEENDPSAMTVWGVFRDEANNPKMVLMYAWQERLEIHELVEKVIDTCTRGTKLKVDPVTGEKKLVSPRFRVDRLLVEAKASGLSVAQEIHRLAGFSGKFGVELVNPQRQGDKVARVHSIQHLFSDGMIYAPDKDWADMVINQMAVFPKSSHDDLVDSTSMALRYLRDAGFALKAEEQKVDDDALIAYRPKLRALYPV